MRFAHLGSVKDVKFSIMGVHTAKSQIFMEHVCVVACARDEPDVLEVGEGDAKQ